MAEILWVAGGEQLATGRARLVLKENATNRGGNRNASQTEKQIYDCHKRATAAGGIAEPYNLAQKRFISTGLEERLQ